MLPVIGIPRETVRGVNAPPLNTPLHVNTPQFTELEAQNATSEERQAFSEDAARFTPMHNQPLTTSPGRFHMHSVRQSGRG